MSTKITVEFVLGNFTAVATGTYSPATPDVMYLRNGDPGHPGDPEELEVEFLLLKHGREFIDITSVIDALPEGAWETVQDKVLEELYNDDMDIDPRDDIPNDEGIQP